MSGTVAPRDEEPGKLGGARGEFVGSLPRRLEMLRTALRALEEVPSDPERQNGLLRRLHALGSAARVLGFASVAEALGESEKSLRGTTAGKPMPLADLSRTIDLLPSLVVGKVPERQPETSSNSFPISVLVFGPEGLAEALKHGDGISVECERTEDPARARELARIIGPDVAVIDADRKGAAELVQLFAEDPLVEPVPVLVVGSFETAEAAAVFVERGAGRVLPKPVSPDALVRALDDLRQLATRPRAPRQPLGQLTVSALSDRIAEEVRRGLVDALESGAHAHPVGFGEGSDVLAAVWGAVARVRELVTLRSQGAVRFQPIGPEGGVPVAPWAAEERRAGDRVSRSARAATGVSLNGRRVLVADDDPAVVWFMSGLLKAVGAEVIEAHNGRQALEMVSESWPDAVISDVLMPELDGFKLCHEIKRDVAVRDVPVILLSWKEDLLQRLRELGADADGYLRKEAAASTVVERVREVLRPRARVEERIEAGGEVRGRLDGITVRLLLELVCRHRRDVRLSVRDAIYLWELQVRSGRLLSVTRSSAQGDFARGPAVMPGLLGASAGRFVIEPDSTSIRPEFRGDLAEILSEPLARARAALRAVSSDALVRITRVRFEDAAVEAYLSCTPEPALSLTRRLLSGAAPRDLVLEGNVDPRLLETILSDFARRGALLAVDREPGASLIPPARVEKPSSVADDEDLDWEEELSEADVAAAAPVPSPALAPAEPIAAPFAAEATPASAAPDAPSEPQTLSVSGPSEMPFDAQPTPAVDWTVGPLFGFSPVEQGTLPGVGSSLPEARTRDEKPASPEDEELSSVSVKSASPSEAPEEEPQPLSAEDVAATSAPSEPPAEAADEGKDLLALLNEEPEAEESSPLLGFEVRPTQKVSEPPQSGHSPLSEPPPVPSAPLSTDALLAALSPEPAPVVTSGDELEVQSPSEPPPRASASIEATESADEAAISSREVPTVPPKHQAEAPRSYFVSFVVGIASFAAFYSLVNWWSDIAGFASRVLKPASNASELASSATLPASSAAEHAPTAPPTIETLALPDGLEVESGSGLLEVAILSPDALYVDGTFVGRGPTRRVPLKPGRHSLVMGEGEPRSVIDFEVASGRRTRVSRSTP